MTFQQLLSDFLQPVNTDEQFWMDQEMEKFVAEFGQWNGSTIYVNPTGSQLCYYKLPTFYDAVVKMFQAQPKGTKYSVLTDEGFIEFTHAVHDFYDINISMVAFRKSQDQNDISDILRDFLRELIDDKRIRKISFLIPSPRLRHLLEDEKAFKEINGSFVLYK